MLHLVTPWLEPGLEPPALVSRNRCVLAPVCHGVALNPGPGDHRVLCIVCIAFDLVVDWDCFLLLCPHQCYCTGSGARSVPVASLRSLGVGSA